MVAATLLTSEETVTKQRLTLWAVEAVVLHEQVSAATGGFVHTLCGMAVSWALYRGLCSAACRSSSLTNVWFFVHYVSGPCIVSVVLES